jgi:hypothetical protein
MPTDFKYILKNKAFILPPRDIPYMAYKQLLFFVSRLRTGRGHVASWGPRFRGIDKAREQYSLIELCGLQWSISVEKARSEVFGLGAEQFIEVRYEDIVEKPEEQLARLFQFMELSVDEGAAPIFLSDRIFKTSVGRWRTELDENEKRLLDALIGPTLVNCGYKV